jgi:hypothetical protein
MISRINNAVTPDNKYMFDTTAYFPRGNWQVDSFQAQIAAQEQWQLWSEEIIKAKMNM